LYFIINYVTSFISENIYSYRGDNLIREGDTVIVYEGADSMKQLVMKKGGKLQNKSGCFNHDDIVGKCEFGSKVYSKNFKGFVHLLRPTSHIHTASLSQRTQILYTPDISQVVFRLQLRPGMRVVESGTGSGSLSTSIIRSLLPSGHLFTYEFN
jgi:tRNA (adenine57-N1/adenine58-N1)-methyltransferase